MVQGWGVAYQGVCARPSLHCVRLVEHVHDRRARATLVLGRNPVPVRVAAADLAAGARVPPPVYTCRAVAKQRGVVHVEADVGLASLVHGPADAFALDLEANEAKQGQPRRYGGRGSGRGQ